MHRVPLEIVRTTPLRVSILPVQSLLHVLKEALGTERADTPAAWVAAVREQLTARDVRALTALLDAEVAELPVTLTGTVDVPGGPFEDAIQALMGGGAPADYLTALLHAWKGFGPVWRGVSARLDEEVERIAVASALDEHMQVLDGLFPGVAVRDGHWELPASQAPGQATLEPRGLVLVPLVGGPRAWGVTFLRPGVIRSVAYPARLQRRPEKAHASLGALVGRPRAQILQAAARPLSIGRLAELMGTVASVATHHVDALEAADLVVRERRGRRVLVHQTARGRRLLALYGVRSTRAAAAGSAPRT